MSSMCACFRWCLCLFLLRCNLTLSARPNAQPGPGLDDDDDNDTPGLDAVVALAEEGGAFKQEPPEVEVSQSPTPWYKKFTNFVSEKASTVKEAAKHHSKKAIAVAVQEAIRFAIHTGLVQHKIEQALGTKVTIKEIDFSTFGTGDADGKLVLKGIDIYNTVFGDNSGIEYHDFDDGQMKKARGSSYDFQHEYNPGCEQGRYDKDRCNLIASIAQVEITGTDFFKVAGWVKDSVKQMSLDTKTSKDQWKGPKKFEFEHLIIADLVLYVNVRKHQTNVGCFVNLKKQLDAWSQEIASRMCCSKTGKSEKPYCDSDHTHEQASTEAQEQCREQQGYWGGIKMDYKTVQLKDLKVKLLYPLPTKTSAASSIALLSDFTLNNEVALKKHVEGTSQKSAAVMLSGVTKALGQMSSSVLSLFAAAGLHEAEEASVHLALGDEESLKDVDKLSIEHVREPPSTLSKISKSLTFK